MILSSIPKHRTIPTLLIAFLFVFNLALAQSTSQIPADSIDAIIRTHMSTEHISGVSIAVVRQGNVVLAKGYGMANVELNIPATPQSVFAIGSVSKQFIATGILILAQEGKLKLDDDIHTYYPQAPQIWQGITLRHLLAHTSGIIREAPAFESAKIQPDSVVVQSAFPLPLEFPIGTKWQYCNVGYFALADIIRKVSGQPWEIFLKQRVFTPVGMTATRTTTLSEIVPNRADGYEWTDNHLHRALAYLALRPSGAFLSTVLDLAKWDAALYTTKILTEASQKQMLTPFVLKNGTPYPYGMGWRVDSLLGTQWVHHGGSLPGFRSEYARFPQVGLSIIVLTNGEQAAPEKIAKEIAALYLRTAAGKPIRGK